MPKDRFYDVPSRKDAEEGVYAYWPRFLPLYDLVDELREALTDLHAEVEMAESVGICLDDRVPSLRAGQLLATLPNFNDV